MLPGTHTAAGNCGVELGVARETNIVSIAAAGAAHTVLDCGGGGTSGGFIVKPPHPVRWCKWKPVLKVSDFSASD
jgi:hypothetical protein